ncbi:MAG: flagellar biosynthetic protein FliQ [Nannocystaceae bacterium]|nr:flagellar biosynthetic protein FliQ [Nannocystaceae bacterium]
MNDPVVLDLLYGALLTASTVAAPILLASLAVGLTTALLQAATQLQENVISFVPKITVVVGTLALSGHWMLAKLVDYGTLVIRSMAELGAVQGAG